MPDSLIVKSAAGYKTFTIILMEREQLASNESDCVNEGRMIASILYGHLPSKTAQAVKDEMNAMWGGF
jgi:hypothetical protein